jgi:hypothetical protein
MTALAKCEPLSDLIVVGLPKRPKCCSKPLAAYSAVASGTGYSSTHLVKVSMKVRTYALSG